MRLFGFACLWGVLAALMWSVAGPAAARHLQLEHLLCVGGASSASEAFALPVETLDCSGSRFGNRSRFVRTHVDVSQSMTFGGQPLVWQTDPATFDAMLVRFTYADGERRLIDVDPQMAARNWFARTRFSVPVPQTETDLVAVDVVVDRPRTEALTREARLVTRSVAQRQHYIRSLIYALACGLLLAPLVFDFLFMRMLRSRFIAWHAGMTFGLLGFVYFNSGLVFLTFPNFPLDIRFHLNTLTLAFAIACAVMFVFSILEKGLTPRWLERVLIGLTGVMLLAKAITLFDFEQWRIGSHSFFLATMFPLAIALVTTVGCALRKGSRVAFFLMVALAPIVIGGIIQFLVVISVVPARFPLDDYLFAAMVVLVLGTTTAVGDRFMVLRVERDRANIRAIKLQRMAHSDALTGVANRRAFERIERISEGEALLVADIDHFKAINDQRGHLTGDAVIAETAKRLRDAFPPEWEATIYRLGGEEFAVICACPDVSTLREIAERLRHSVEAGERRRADDVPAVTISIGGAMGHGRPMRSVYAEADSALYRAKKTGRNRVAIAEDV